MGIADHFGWAVAVTAAADHRVVDRRRVELVESGVCEAPVHYEGARLGVGGTATLIEEVRASIRRAAGAGLDELAAAVGAPVASISLRTWPPDFPTDVAVQLQSPWEARADAVMYRQELSDLARERGLGGPPLRREACGRGGRRHPRRAGRGPSPSTTCRAGPAVDEGPPHRVRRRDRREKRWGLTVGRP